MKKKEDEKKTTDIHQSREETFPKYDFQIDLNNKNLAHTLVIESVGKNKKILDVGCATGYLDKVFVEFGCNVTGIDVDAESVKRAGRYCEKAIQADVEHLNWEDTFGEERFDVILFADVLEHLVDPLKVLTLAREYLTPEGYVTACIPNVAHASLRLQLLQGEFQYRKLGLLDESHLRFFTIRSIKEMFDRAGYVIVDIKRINLGPFDTEVHLQPEAFTQSTIDFILKDPESTTYQYICRAHGKNRSIAFSHVHDETNQREEKYTQELDQVKNHLLKSEEEKSLLRKDLRECLKDHTEIQQKLKIAEIKIRYFETEQVEHEIEKLQFHQELSTLYPSIDIVTVLYNSDRHLQGFFNSLRRLNYPSHKLTLTVIDNASKSDPETLVKSLSSTLDFSCNYIRSSKNIGFAGGANYGADLGKSEYICVVNPDTEFYPDTLKELATAVVKEPLVGMADSRQVPYEHPKYFNPKTQETSWCSGACFLIRRKLVDKIGLFDSKFFMYCEDVDLSWRVWASGYKCVYASKSNITHHKNPENYKPSVDYYFGIRNAFLMRLIYGNRKDIIQFHNNICRELRGGQGDPKFRRYLWKACTSHLALIPHALWRRWKMPSKRNRWIKFSNWDYGEKK